MKKRTGKPVLFAYSSDSAIQIAAVPIATTANRTADNVIVLFAIEAIIDRMYVIMINTENVFDDLPTANAQSAPAKTDVDGGITISDQAASEGKNRIAPMNGIFPKMDSSQISNRQTTCHTITPANSPSNDRKNLTKPFFFLGA